MKNWIKLCFLICFAVICNAAFAAMDGPTGLAVDAKGNLYVANFQSNQIQVYSPQHSLISNKTITKDVSGPLAVALDPLGDVWVANFSSSALTGYTAKGKELTPITSGISSPTAMAMDGAGNFWVVNGANSFAVLDAFGDLMRTANVSALGAGANTITSICVFNGLVMFGNDAELFQMLETEYVATGGAGGILSPYRQGVAVAYDASGNEWVAESDGSVYLYGTLKIISLSYQPSGMVVDSARKRVYFSHNAGNSVDVYTTSGKFVTTIQ